LDRTTNLIDPAAQLFSPTAAAMGSGSYTGGMAGCAGVFQSMCNAFGDIKRQAEGFASHLTLSAQGCILAICASLAFQDGYLTGSWSGNLPRLSLRDEEGVLRDPGEVFNQSIGFGAGIGWSSTTPSMTSSPSVGACEYDEVGGCVSGWPSDGGTFSVSGGGGLGWMVFGNVSSKTWKLW